MTRHNSSKDIANSNNPIKLLNLIDLTRPFHPTIANYTFFPNLYKTFAKIEHILDHTPNSIFFYNAAFLPLAIIDVKLKCLLETNLNKYIYKNKMFAHH